MQCATAPQIRSTGGVVVQYTTTVYNPSEILLKWRRTNVAQSTVPKNAKIAGEVAGGK